MEGLPSLASLDGRADLWLLPERGLDSPAVCDLSDHLPSDERIRYERLRVEASRRLFLGARFLSRHAISVYTGVPAARLAFGVGDHGRPHLVPNPWDLQFNLSHTRGLVACVITRGHHCGVDVERTPAEPRLVNALVPFFAAEERLHLAIVPEPDRGRLAIDYWVLKEAYLKALGTGLTRSLNSFTIHRLPSQPVMVRDDWSESRGQTWQFELHRVGHDHMVGVALGVRHSSRQAPPVPVHTLEAARFFPLT
jgi:4'-phosphopantetheinyl transferase